MNRRLVALATAALFGFSPGSAWSADEPFVCAGESVVDAYISAADPLVVARIVFVAFPDEPPARQALPSWASTLRAELADFINVMSHGQQNFDISILTRSDDPTKAWIANSPACAYSSDFGELNTQIMETIAAQVPGTPWQNVEQVFMIHYTCGWQTQPGLGCGVGGYSTLGLKRTIPGFTAPGSGGTSQHMLSGTCTTYSPINDYPQYEWAVWGAAHEYGHRIPGVFHPPHSRTDQPPVVDYGHYDVMNGNSSWPKYRDGLVPYHALNLAGAGWLPVQTITTTTLGLAVKDVCDPTAVGYRVNTSNPSQYFFLVNHQASSYDVKYGASGLLITHVLEPFLAWDVEAAGGKFTSGNPDRACGLDLLEEPGSYIGTGGDFFNEPNNKRNFGPETNPNTFLYSPATYNSCQTVRASISFENIQRDPGTGHMLVDVYLQPIQFVTFPNGGEFHAAKNNLVVTWRYRDPAVSGILTVDIGLSSDGGLTWPGNFANEPNTGSFSVSGYSLWVAGDQYRVRVVSYDPIANALDTSDGNFTVWGIIESSVTPTVTISCQGITLNVPWQTTVATDAALDKLGVFTPLQTNPSKPTLCGQNPAYTVTGGAGGTSHQLVWNGPCQTGLWAFHVRSTKGTGETWSNCMYIDVTSCPSCPPPCHPPCELE